MSMEQSTVGSSFHRPSGLPNISAAASYNNLNQSEHQEAFLAEMPLWYDSIQVTMYVIAIVLAVIGNSTVIAVFVKGHKSASSLRLYLINLAVSDLVMAIFCLPVTAISKIMKYWIFGAFACPLLMFIQPAAVTTSVFTNVAIGINRFRVTMFPFSQSVSRRSHIREFITFAVIWGVSALLAGVNLFVARVVEKDERDGNGTFEVCDEAWDSEDYRRGYTFFLLSITYLIPVVMLLFTYGAISVHLYRSSRGERGAGFDDEIKKKKKTVRMLVTIIVLFAISWFPLHLFFLYYDANVEFVERNLFEFGIVYDASHWLAMSNSFQNPIIYSFMNDAFRKDFMELASTCWPLKRCFRSPSSQTSGFLETSVAKQQSIRNPIQQVAPVKQATKDAVLLDAEVHKTAHETEQIPLVVNGDGSNIAI